MIVLHEPKIIVLKARKVASTSFEIALSKFATENSIITPITENDENIRKELGFRGPQNYKYTDGESLVIDNPKDSKKFHDERDSFKFYNHISAENAKCRLGNVIWNSYTKISIIRNPFEYTVSIYFFLLSMQGKQPQDVNFEQWCLANQDKLSLNDDIYNIAGKNVIDIMLNYERLREDVCLLESRFGPLKGLADTFRGITAKAKIRPEYATVKYMFGQAPKAREFIADLHSESINKYKFKIP